MTQTMTDTSPTSYISMTADELAAAICLNSQCAHYQAANTGHLVRASAIPRKDGTVTPRYRCKGCNRQFPLSRIKEGGRHYRIRHAPTVVDDALARLDKGESVPAVALAHDVDVRTVMKWQQRRDGPPD